LTTLPSTKTMLEAPGCRRSGRAGCGAELATKCSILAETKEGGGWRITKSCSSRRVADWLGEYPRGDAWDHLRDRRPSRSRLTHRADAASTREARARTGQPATGPQGGASTSSSAAKPAVQAERRDRGGGLRGQARGVCPPATWRGPSGTTSPRMAELIIVSTRLSDDPRGDNRDDPARTSGPE